MDRLIHALRAKYPGLDRDAKQGSRRAAIRLFCLECMGGSSGDVAGCEERICPLWLYRKGVAEKVDNVRPL